MAVEVTNNGHFSRAFKVRGGFVEVKPGQTASLEPLVPIGDVGGLTVVAIADPPKSGKTAKADPPQA